MRVDIAVIVFYRSSDSSPVSPFESQPESDEVMPALSEPESDEVMHALSQPESDEVKEIQAVIQIQSDDQESMNDEQDMPDIPNESRKLDMCGDITECDPLSKSDDDVVCCGEMSECEKSVEDTERLAECEVCELEARDMYSDVKDVSLCRDVMCLVRSKSLNQLVIIHQKLAVDPCCISRTHSCSHISLTPITSRLPDEECHSKADPASTCLELAPVCPEVTPVIPEVAPAPQCPGVASEVTPVCLRVAPSPQRPSHVWHVNVIMKTVDEDTWSIDSSDMPRTYVTHNV